jgi:hypothetical protein
MKVNKLEGIFAIKSMKFFNFFYEFMKLYCKEQTYFVHQRSAEFFSQFSLFTRSAGELPKK